MKEMSSSIKDKYMTPEVEIIELCTEGATLLTGSNTNQDFSSNSGQVEDPFSDRVWDI